MNVRKEKGIKKGFSICKVNECRKEKGIKKGFSICKVNECRKEKGTKLNRQKKTMKMN